MAILCQQVFPRRFITKHKPLLTSMDDYFPKAHHLKLCSGTVSDEGLNMDFYSTLGLLSADSLFILCEVAKGVTCSPVKTEQATPASAPPPTQLARAARQCDEKRWTVPRPQTWFLRSVCRAGHWVCRGDCRHFCVTSLGPAALSPAR